MSTAETTDLAPSLALEPTARPQFMTGFDGGGMAPFSERICQILAAPVDHDAVEIKPDGIVFLPGIEWTRQLTRAFGAGGWCIMPRSPARTLRDNNIVTYHGVLVCHGRYVAEAVGECAYYANNPTMSYATALEGAKTDAIGRCCKGLSMFSELWDKAFIEKWKAKYAEQYEGVKWNGKTQKEERKKMWRRKDHANRQPLDDLDLMSGAGGTVKPPAPSAPASAPVATPASAPTAAPLAKKAPREEDDEPTPSEVENGQAFVADPRGVDTGEAATEAQRVSIRDEVKRLGWKAPFYKMWLKGLFGFDTPGSLTKDQATNALLLLEHWGKDSYKPLLEDMRKDGLVKERE